LKRFFGALAKARETLANDPTAWDAIKARLKLTDDAALAIYKKRYLDGAPKRAVAEEAVDAKALYAVLAEIGGAALVGDARALDAATFYDPNGAP
jgi:NitT/TauT family transport system substrate-binding protein